MYCRKELALSLFISRRTFWIGPLVYLVSEPVDRKKGSNIDWGGVELSKLLGEGTVRFKRFSFLTSFLFLSLVLPLSSWLLALADAAAVGACFGVYVLLPECQFWQNRQQ